MLDSEGSGTLRLTRGGKGRPSRSCSFSANGRSHDSVPDRFVALVLDKGHPDAIFCEELKRNMSDGFKSATFGDASNATEAIELAS